VGYFALFQQTTQRKQSPDGRKIAQSGHSGYVPTYQGNQIGRISPIVFSLGSCYSYLHMWAQIQLFVLSKKFVSLQLLSFGQVSVLQYVNIGGLGTYVVFHFRQQ
jgi:hypothetical protein